DALHPYPAGLVIATNGGSLRPGPRRWQADGRPKHLRLAQQGSLKRLRLDRIALYQWHRPDPAVPFEESVGALADFRREGLVQHVGLSNVTVRHLEAARRIVPIASVQNAYNVSDRGSEDLARACGRAGIAFVPYYPLGVGRLAAAGGALREVASRLSATPTQVALAWLIDRSPVILPIPGTSSLAHLAENVGAAGLHLSEEDRRRLDDR
ncbi:MAG: oxidoreductase, partial [Armatimonadetes bacterium]|nr:oxidoreductase [Armatimonadota bacterium]